MSPGSTSDDKEDQQLASSQKTVPQQDLNKLRVVVGLFEQPSKLMAAVKALMAQGINGSDLCVFGTTDTLSMTESMFQNRAIIDAALHALFMDTETFLGIESSLTIAGSRGKLLSTLRSLMNKRRMNDPTHSCDGCRKISSKLVACTNQGQLVLVVDVAKPRQLIHASKILLKFSPNALQTHEILQ